MALSNYNELQTAIADQIMRPDAPIASFISLGESDVNTMLRHYMQETITSISTVDNAVTLPVDFLAADKIEVNGEPATPVSIYGGRVPSGKVGYYRRGNSYRFVPEQTEPRNVQITYYARIPSLTDAAPTNWLLRDYPQVLFNASLVHAYRYLKDAEAMAEAKQFMQEAVGLVMANHKSAVNSGNQFDIEIGGTFYDY